MDSEPGVLRPNLRSTAFEIDSSAPKVSPSSITTFGGVVWLDVPVNLGEPWHILGSGFFFLLDMLQSTFKNELGYKGRV